MKNASSAYSSRSLGQYFLPYQVAWLKDTGRLKICEKSRRIGMTYVQSYEDVRDASRRTNPVDIWFSSADESAAREYIRYCEQWVQMLKLAAEPMGETVIDSDRDIKVFAIEFASGKRINALSSNPKAFRSKGGKLVLDEFAFHEDQEAMWKAARPILTWGYDCRILSTYNGKGNRYYRMVEEAKRGNGWNLHSCTIEQAVNVGLADRICGRELTPQEREIWLGEERATCGDEETWMQEYMCVPVDGATAWLPWDAIATVESPEAGKPEFYGKHYCYFGMDIARRRDLTVIWVLERLGDVLWTREVVALKNASFAAQKAELERLMKQYRILRGCLDQTGMGEQLAEESKQQWGQYRIEGVLFSNAAKQDLAICLKQNIEDRRLRIPADKDIRESLHSVKKTTTATGHPRFDAERSDIGHADYFWALALAVHAAGNVVPIEFQSLGVPSMAAASAAFSQPLGI